jgi:hypothetical protein
MKVNFNSIDLKTVKHQRCESCFFTGISNFHFCALLPMFICLKDSQIYTPTQEFFEVFNL